MSDIDPTIQDVELAKTILQKTGWAVNENTGYKVTIIAKEICMKTEPFRAEIERLRAEVAELLANGDRTNATINALQAELEKYKLNSTTARVRELEGLFDYMKARAERAEAELQHARETAGQLFKELMEKLGYWVPPVEQEALAQKEPPDASR